MEKKKFSKLNIAKKILSIVAKLLYDFLILFCILLIVIVAWQRITDSNKSVYGYRLFRIISGSMVPDYNIDEIVVCKDIDVNDIKVGDVVVYRGRIGELNNKLIMHKVVDINREDYGLIFHVKGIQNTASDPNVQSGQIVGKVVFKSQTLTYVYSLATSLYSSFFIVIVLVINVFLAFRPRKREVMQLNEYNEDVNNEEKENLKVEEHKRYTLKNYEQDIKIIKQQKIKENEEREEKIQNILKEIEEAEKIKEENKRLQEENKKLKEKVENSKKTRKKVEKKNPEKNQKTNKNKK